MKISKRSFERIYATLYLALIMIAIVMISGIILLSQVFNSIIINISAIVILINAAIISIICCFDVISKLDDIKEYQELEESDN